MVSRVASRSQYFNHNMKRVANRSQYFHWFYSRVALSAWLLHSAVESTAKSCVPYQRRLQILTCNQRIARPQPECFAWRISLFCGLRWPSEPLRSNLGWWSGWRSGSCSPSWWRPPRTRCWGWRGRNTCTCRKPFHDGQPPPEKKKVKLRLTKTKRYWVFFFGLPRPLHSIQRSKGIFYSSFKIASWLINLLKLLLRTLQYWIERVPNSTHGSGLWL